jgi:Na+/glutamate symporter
MLWYVTAQPIVAIGLAIAADVFAAIPTIRKAWTHPETETALEYAATVISAAMGLLAIQTWRLTEFLFPVYLILLNGLILLIIYRKLFGFRQFVD